MYLLSYKLCFCKEGAVWRRLRRIEGGEGAEEGGERRLRNGLLVSLQPPPAGKIQFSSDNVLSRDSFDKRKHHYILYN